MLEIWIKFDRLYQIRNIRFESNNKFKNIYEWMSISILEIVINKLLEKIETIRDKKIETIRDKKNW